MSALLLLLQLTILSRCAEREPGEDLFEDTTDTSAAALAALTSLSGTAPFAAFTAELRIDKLLQRCGRPLFCLRIGVRVLEDRLDAADRAFESLLILLRFSL